MSWENAIGLVFEILPPVIDILCACCTADQGIATAAADRCGRLEMSRLSRYRPGSWSTFGIAGSGPRYDHRTVRDAQEWKL